MSIHARMQSSPPSRRARAGRVGSAASVALLAMAVSLCLAPTVASASTGQVSIQTNITYGQAGGTTLLMDAYLPQASGRAPAVVFIHGGGWTGGDKRSGAATCKYFASNGFACFAIDYRLAPEFPFPDGVDDAMQAVRFVRQNAARFHVDPNRIAAAGPSAGGNIAAYVGDVGSGPLDRGARVCAVLAWSGPLDLTSMAQHSLLARADLVRRYLGLPVSDPSAMTRLAQASPITLLDSTDPPMFLSYATADPIVPVRQASRIEGALKTYGIPYKAVILNDAYHALNGPNFHDLMPSSLAFLKTYVARYKPQHASPSPRHSTTGPTPTATPPARSSRFSPLVIGLIVLIVVLLGILIAVLVRWRRMAPYRR